MPTVNPITFRDVNPGDPIRADLMNALIQAARQAGNLRVGGKLASRRGPGGGTQLCYVGATDFVRFGTAAANIAPRSGTAGVVGTLNLISVAVDGTIATTGDTLSVVNISSSTFSAGVSIKSGQYCCALFLDPAWVVFPLEC